MSIFNKKYKKGFTLIELLVVVAIIGLLSSIVLTSLNSARAKARDARRLSDMKTLQLAFETAKANGVQLPASYTHTALLASFLVPAYMSSVPVEVSPISTNVGDLYYYCNVNSLGTGNLCHNDTDNNTYAIVFNTESKTSLGASGRYCLTSTGIFKAETINTFVNKCRQR